MRCLLDLQVKQFFVGQDHVGDVPLHLKIASGLATGAIAITVASPTDLVKVRMQSEGKKSPGQAKKYPNAFKAYGIIRREEGMLGLWKGLGPNIARNAIINAAELASYDQIKVCAALPGRPWTCCSCCVTFLLKH
eukprot:GHRQ01017460.1.p1 GENE.GHRQ01017460.1~~GHRQ01017460.1.p1  ORF type:complete len:135 (+),score=54.40 GHRQ01017460.1:1378-1782(+)